MTLSRRRSTAPRAPFVVSNEWRAAFETQCTRELLRRAERFAERRARKLRVVDVVVDDDYAPHLVQDVLGDTVTGLLRWDPCGECLEDHLMDAIATRVHHEVARARRFPHVSLDDDPAVSRTTLAVADASLL